MPLGIALAAEQLTALTPEGYTTFYQSPTVALTEDMQTLLTPAGYADFYHAMIDHNPLLLDSIAMVEGSVTAQ